MMKMALMLLLAAVAATCVQSVPVLPRHPFARPDLRSVEEDTEEKRDSVSEYLKTIQHLQPNRKRTAPFHDDDPLLQLLKPGSPKGPQQHKTLSPWRRHLDEMDARQQKEELHDRDYFEAIGLGSGSWGLGRRGGSHDGYGKRSDSGSW